MQRCRNIFRVMEDKEMNRGMVARTGIRGLIMDNTAETLLEQIDCLVTALKPPEPPGFVTPVALED